MCGSPLPAVLVLFKREAMSAFPVGEDGAGPFGKREVTRTDLSGMAWITSGALRIIGRAALDRSDASATCFSCIRGATARRIDARSCPEGRQMRSPRSAWDSSNVRQRAESLGQQRQPTRRNSCMMPAAVAMLLGACNMPPCCRMRLAQRTAIPQATRGPGPTRGRLLRGRPVQPTPPDCD